MDINKKTEKAKKISEKERIRYAAVIGVLILLIIGLCAYVFVDFRTDSRALDAQKAFLRTGMTGSARALSEDIGEGNMILAYHHASETAEYAALLGEERGERMFRLISAAILDGSLPSGVAAEIDGFIASGTVPEESLVSDADPADEIAENEPESSRTDGYGTAERCALRFFGGSVVSSGRRIENGDYLFSVSNAYALIDGESSLPIEAAISLEEGEPVLGDGECVSSAKKFISDFFPREVAAKAVVMNVRDTGGRAEVTARVEDQLMIFTVRRDSGRVVRFISSRIGE